MKVGHWQVAVVCAILLARLASPALSAGPATQAVEKKLNAELVNLPANTRVHIKPNRNPEGRSYSGICWGNGMLFYFGGYHFSYACNDVELYDVAANTWTQATEPEDYRDAKKWKHLTPEQVKSTEENGRGWFLPGILSPKGRPLAPHTYQQHVWWPEEQAFYNMLMGTGLWAFDPAKKEWREVAKQLPAGIRGLHAYGLYYDPGLKSVFAVIAGGENSGAHLFDREKKTWTLKCRLPSGAWSEVHAAYDSTRKVHVVHTQRKWYDLDLAAGTFKSIKGPEEAMKAAGKFPDNAQQQGLNEYSLAYDPDAKSTLLVTKKEYYDNNKLPVDLWAYDAGKDDWSEVKLSGQAPTGFATWGLLVYDPEHKCCLFLNLLGVQGSPRRGGPVNGLFAFRYKKEEANR